ncbi:MULTISPECIES: hypothetical protein [unclassified Kitasatospora]
MTPGPSVSAITDPTEFDGAERSFAIAPPAELMAVLRRLKEGRRAG